MYAGPPRDTRESLDSLRITTGSATLQELAARRRRPRVEDGLRAAERPRQRDTASTPPVVFPPRSARSSCYPFRRCRSPPRCRSPCCVLAHEGDDSRGKLKHLVADRSSLRLVLCCSQTPVDRGIHLSFAPATHRRVSPEYAVMSPDLFHSADRRGNNPPATPTAECASAADAWHAVRHPAMTTPHLRRRVVGMPHWPQETLP